MANNSWNTALYEGKHSFVWQYDVTYAVLFERPTPLEAGDAGMANWIGMFAGSFLKGLSGEQQAQVIQAVEERLQPTLYRDGRWWADYRRIRVVAIKV